MTKSDVVAVDQENRGLYEIYNRSREYFGHSECGGLGWFIASGSLSWVVELMLRRLQKWWSSRWLCMERRTAAIWILTSFRSYNLTQAFKLSEPSEDTVALQKASTQIKYCIISTFCFYYIVRKSNHLVNLRTIRYEETT